MKNKGQNPDDLRQKLLDDVYAGAFSGGMPAMLLEEDKIRNADDEELEDIARRHGLK